MAPLNFHKLLKYLAPTNYLFGASASLNIDLHWTFFFDTSTFQDGEKYRVQKPIKYPEIAFENHRSQVIEIAARVQENDQENFHLVCMKSAFL